MDLHRLSKFMSRSTLASKQFDAAFVRQGDSPNSSWMRSDILTDAPFANQACTRVPVEKPCAKHVTRVHLHKILVKPYAHLVLVAPMLLLLE